METEVTIREDGVTVKRLFDAEVERVFDAWTDPEKVSTWWGCAMTTKVESTVDLRVGGQYRHKMTMEGHGDYDAIGTIVALEAPNFFAYTIEMPAMEGMPAMPTQGIQVRFEDVEGKTLVTLDHSGIVMDMIKGEVKKGWSAAFDKLANRLPEFSG